MRRAQPLLRRAVQQARQVPSPAASPVCAPVGPTACQQNSPSQGQEEQERSSLATSGRFHGNNSDNIPYECRYNLFKRPQGAVHKAASRELDSAGMPRLGGEAGPWGPSVCLAHCEGEGGGVVQGRSVRHAWRAGGVPSEECYSNVGPTGQRGLSTKAKKGGKGGKKKAQAGTAEAAQTPTGASSKEEAEEAEGGGEETEVDDIRDLHSAPTNNSFLLSKSALEALLPEGLPFGIAREFEGEASRTRNVAPFLVRTRLKEFLHSLTSAAPGFTPTSSSTDSEGPEPPSPSSQSEGGEQAPPTPRTAFLLVGPTGSGKSVLLGLAVAWARAQGWLVLYEPQGRNWGRGGVYYHQPGMKLWDTPMHAQAVLQSFLKAHEPLLASLPLASREPLPLTEAPTPDVEPTPSKGATEPELFKLPDEPEPATLASLVRAGAEDADVAVSCLVRLREELEHVRSVPVLIALDEFNAWFTFSAYFESTGERSRREIHANELRAVNAYRPMEPRTIEPPSRVLMAGAFSESIAVGALAPRLPGIPRGAAYPVPRMTLEESRQLILNQIIMRDGAPPDNVDEAQIATMHYLAVGNGLLLKNLALLI